MRELRKMKSRLIKKSEYIDIETGESIFNNWVIYDTLKINYLAYHNLLNNNDIRREFIRYYYAYIHGKYILSEEHICRELNTIL